MGRCIGVEYGPKIEKDECTQDMKVVPRTLWTFMGPIEKEG